MQIIYELDSGCIVNNESEQYLANAGARGALGTITIEQNISTEELVLYTVNVSTKKIVKLVNSLQEKEKLTYLDGARAVRNLMLSQTDTLMGQSDRLSLAEKEALEQFRQDLRDFNKNLELNENHHSGAKIQLVLPEVPEVLKKYKLFY